MIHAIFCSIVILICILQVYVVTAYNRPMTGLINLISLTFLSAMILVEEKIHFLPWVLIIVYVGAVAMLFLFVIMLMNPINKTKPLWHGITFWVLLVLSHTWSKTYYLFVSSEKEYRISPLTQTSDGIIQLSNMLYENNYLLVIILTYVLVGTLIGSYLLAQQK